MIVIHKSPNADSRSSNGIPSVDELRDATVSHIEDVKHGMQFMADLIEDRGVYHDHTKLQNMDEYHAALASGHIKDTAWYNKHINEERHHLKSHVPNDVTIVDVVEHLVDCTMAGLARSGQVYDVDLSAEVLQLAVANTVEMLKNNTTVINDESGFLNDRTE